MKATLKLPKIKRKKVWAGMYGGHYDVIVFFKYKPKKDTSTHHMIKSFYDCYDNRELIIGDLDMITFNELYPNADLSAYLINGRPKEIEIPEVFQIEIEAFWDEDGKMRSINYNLDW